MTLYVVHRHNEFFKNGTYLEDDEDGYVQAIRMVQRGGRAIPEGFYGPLVPIGIVRDSITAVLEKGFDHRRQVLEV